MTPDLVRFIFEIEKFRDKPYFATETEKEKGIVSFGCGSTITLQPGQTISQIPNITVERAIHLIKDKLTADEIAFRKKIKAAPFSELKPNQIDAVLSNAYNAGLGGIPKMLKALAKLDIESAAVQFMNGIYQKDVNGKAIALAGLCYRRASEYDIFTEGVYKVRSSITQKHLDLFLEMNKLPQAIKVIKGLTVEK